MRLQLWASLSILALASCSGSAGVSASVDLPASRTVPAYARNDTGSTSCLTTACIYDYSYSFRTGKARITSYASNASGDVAPLEQIAGKRPGLDHSNYYGVAVGPDGKIYAFNCRNNGNGCTPTVEIYAAGTNGNMPPVAAIGGSKTGLHSRAGYVAVSGDGTIYVVTDDYYGTAVTVYAAGANGNVAPIQTISGSYTKLSESYGIAVDAGGNIYVSNNGRNPGNSILVYSAGSNGNVPPIRDITGSNTRLSFGHLFGMALDSTGNMYVASNGAVILVFAAGATGNVAPIRAILGNKSKLFSVGGVALDANDHLYVSNTNTRSGVGYITVYKPGANGNHRPIQLIKGSATLLSSHYSTGIAVR